MKKTCLIIFALVILSPAVYSKNLKTAIASIGCKQVNSIESIPTVQSKDEHLQWLKNEFGVISRVSFLARCTVGSSFYKFLFEEEVFSSGKNASLRLKQLQKLPENEHSKSDYAVPKILGEGFVRGNKLYTVGVYVSRLEDEGYVKKYRDKLAKKIK